MRTHLCLIFIAMTAPVASAGCTRVGLADSVDLTFDWSPLTGPSDELHTPYVAGADFQLFAIGIDRDDAVGWRLESSDPAVLRIDSTEDGRADVSAVGAGRATVTVLDGDDRPVYDAPVEVRQADRAVLLAHGAAIIERPELQEDWDEVYVVAGGAATFEVHWYEGDERLFGNGALSAIAEGDIAIEPRRTYLFEDREWVTFQPFSVGSYDVSLLANGRAVRTVRIIAVSADVVTSVELHGMNESSAAEGELMTVLAQSYDAEGRPIFGVEYLWDLDGAREEGTGDLYRYTLAPERERTLSASFGGLDAEASIHAREGYVDSTNRLLCAVTHPGLRDGAPAAPVAVATALFFFYGARRRRRVPRDLTT